MKITWKAVGLAVTVAALFAMSSSPVRCAALGRCATVEVPGAIMLPDGTVTNANSMKICLNSRLNPVTGLHEISVDGMPLTLAKSYTGNSEGPASKHPVVVFERINGGAWRLVGYAWPGRGHMETFVLHGTDRPRAQLRADARELLDQREDYVHVAANAGGFR